MAAVASSTCTLEHPQIDGSRWCTEVHVLEGGDTREFYYLLAPGDDADAIMRGRAEAIAAEGND